jgi:hypothetical protein
MPEATTSSGQTSLAAPPVKDSVWPIFISYRRSELTREVALWLKEQLEKQTIEATTGQIFRLDVFVDAAEAHQTDFQANLIPHLQHSRALILLVDDGAAMRRQQVAVDYLYEELDWWGRKRKRTPPIILQMDKVSAKTLTAEPKYAGWRKVNFMDCFWEKWSRDPREEKIEKERLLKHVRDSIRDYGQVIHLEEVQRLKRRALVATGLGVLAGLAAIGALVFFLRAASARDAAEKALTSSFVRTIGSFREGSPTTLDEQDSLWQLAELAPASRNVRKELINSWMQTPDLIVRATSDHSRGLHAAIGLSEPLVAYFDSQAGTAANDLAVAMENALRTDAYHLPSIAKALAVLAGRMDTNSAAMLASRAGAALTTAMENELLTYSYNLPPMAQALAALVGRMDTNSAAALAAKGAVILAAALSKSHYAVYRNAGDEVETLAALAAWMAPEAAAALAEKILASGMEPLSPMEIRGLPNRAEVLAVLAGRMNADQRAPVAGRGAAVLVRATENLWMPLPEIPAELAGLAAWMDPGESVKLAEELVAMIQIAPEAQYDGLSTMAEALAVLAGRMDTNAAATVTASGAVALAEAMEKMHETNNFGYFGLSSEALVKLAKRMDPIAAAFLADDLAKTMEGPLGTNSDRLSGWAKALAAVAGRMNTEVAATVAARGAAVLTNAMEKSRRTDYYNLPTIADALGALAEQMDADSAATAAAYGAAVLTEAMEDPATTDARKLQSMAEALAILTGQMDTNSGAGVAARGAVVLTKSIEKLNRSDYFDLPTMPEALAALASQIPEARHTRLASLSLGLLNRVSSPAIKGNAKPQSWLTAARVSSMLTTADLVEVLKWPFCVGEDQKLVLAELEKRTNRKFDGDVWKFVQQVDPLGIPGVNSRSLELPPKRPQITNAIAELQLLTRAASKKP